MACLMCLAVLEPDEVIDEQFWKVLAEELFPILVSIFASFYPESKIINQSLLEH